MRITADTNVLVRAAVADEPSQTEAARRLLEEAELVAIPLPELCEFVRVLAQGYRRSRLEIAEAIRRLAAAGTVEVDRPAVDAGLRVLEAGGDFADGVIAFVGRQMGGEVFASFDRNAIGLIKATGVPTVELGTE